MLDEYNNYTHKYIDEILDKNYKGKRIILFDAREVDDIQYIENEYMGISIFIDRESAKIEDELLNFADANVEDYNYIKEKVKK